MFHESKPVKVSLTFVFFASSIGFSLGFFIGYITAEPLPEPTAQIVVETK